MPEVEQKIVFRTKVMEVHDFVRAQACQSLILMCFVFLTPLTSAQLATDPDSNNDGVVNFLDFSLLRSCFFAPTMFAGDPCASSDFNGDGTIDEIDVALLAEHFLQSFPTPAEADSLFPTVIPVDDTHELAQVIDVNSDGFLDVVTTSTTQNQVIVKFGSENEEYETSFAFDAYNSGSVSVGDVNRDTITDLIVVEPDNGVVRVYYGDGFDQFFDSQATYSVDGAPNHMIMADINADRLSDLIVYRLSSQDDNTISVLLANPAQTGGFLPRISIANSGSLTAVHVEEFTGDGVPDLLVVDRPENSQMATIFSGSGNGHFSPGAPLNIGGGYLVTVGDFNGDGHQDFLDIQPNVLFTDFTISTLHLNSGNGTFTGSGVSAHMRYTRNVIAANLNNDEYADLVLEQGSNGDESLYLLFGTGSGYFYLNKGLAVRGPMLTTPLDGDELDDIAIQTEDGIRLLISGDGGGYEAPLTKREGDGISNGQFFDLKKGDFNNDGNDDLVTASCGFSLFTAGCDYFYPPDPEATISLNNGEGGFADTDSVPFIELIALFGNIMETGDYNGDNNLDLLVGNDEFSVAGTARIYPGLGDGQMGAYIGQIGLSNYFTGFHSLQSADLNNDQFDDLLIAQTDFDTFETETVVALGDGTGAFDRDSALRIPGVLGGVLVDDFVLGDGNVDLLTRSGYLYSGDGTGAFVFAGSINPGQSIRNIVADDFNGDGARDLLLVSPQKALTILLRLESGGFAAPVELPDTSIAVDFLGIFRSGDINNDGKRDLAIARGREVSIMLGNGDGGFQHGVTVYPGLSVNNFELIDVNQDGRDDLVTAQVDTQWLSIFPVRTPTENGYQVSSR